MGRARRPLPSALTAPRDGRGSEFIPPVFPAPSSPAPARIRHSQLLSWSEVHSCGALIFFFFFLFLPTAARRYIASPQTLQPPCASSHCTSLSSNQSPEGLGSPAFPSATDIDPFPAARHVSPPAATGGPTRARLQPRRSGPLRVAAVGYGERTVRLICVW